MTFWLDVGLGYLLLLGVGMVVGAVVGSRNRRGGGNGGRSQPPTPHPFGPSLALDCPPLGSDFDRALLPGVSFAPNFVPQLGHGTRNLSDSLHEVGNGGRHEQRSEGGSVT